MRSIGNMNQWNNGWPPREVLEEDIRLGQGYVCEEDGEILAVFAYWYGKDCEPSYRTIYEGSWKNDEPYGVIHRIAARSGHKAGRFCMKWAMKESDGHLRMDTHLDNVAMRHVFETMGFERRGVIYLDNGHPREAYEYCRE